MRTTIVLLALIVSAITTANAQPPYQGPIKSVNRTLPKYFKSDSVLVKVRQGELSVEIKNRSTSDTLRYQFCVTWADTATVAADRLDGYGTVDPGERITVYYRSASKIRFIALKRSGNDSTATYRVTNQ